MHPSDFKPGPDGKRFRVHQESFVWYVQYRDPFEGHWRDMSRGKVQQIMIASALEQVAEWEEKSARGGACTVCELYGVPLPVRDDDDGC